MVVKEKETGGNFFSAMSLLHLMTLQLRDLGKKNLGLLADLKSLLGFLSAPLLWFFLFSLLPFNWGNGLYLLFPHSHPSLKKGATRNDPSGAKQNGMEPFHLAVFHLLA